MIEPIDFGKVEEVYALLLSGLTIPNDKIALDKTSANINSRVDRDINFFLVNFILSYYFSATDNYA